MAKSAEISSTNQHNTSNPSTPELSEVRERDCQSRIACHPETRTIPLTDSQQGLWFLDQLYPSSAAYNTHRVIRLRGRLDRPALLRSLAEVVRRHEALRTVFPSIDGRPTAVVNAPFVPQVASIDLRALPNNIRELAVRKAAILEARKRFDLSLGPLLRGCFLQVEDDDHVLTLVTHHMVADGWSMRILLRELGLLYNAARAGETCSLPEPSCQFGDFAERQIRILQGETGDSLVQYWTERLEGAPAELRLPFDRTRSRRPTMQGARRTFRLSDVTVGLLNAVTRREGVTDFMVLLAAFSILLAKYTGQDDLVIGSPFANRLTQETESLVGFVNNTLILRVRLVGDLSFRQLIGQVRGTVLSALAHQELPFENLVRAINPARSTQRMALFQVNFRVLRAQERPADFVGLETELLEIDNGAAKFDLACEMTTGAHGVCGYLEYSTDLFEGETARKIAQDYQDLLIRLFSEPERMIRDITVAHQATGFERFGFGSAK